MKWTLNIEILLIYIVTCQGDGIQVTKNNIRQLLSDSEWELLVGSSPETDYEIIHPSLHRSRRSTTEKTISISGLGKSWLSTISLSDSILSADFTLVRRNKNGTEDVTEQHKNELGCFYRGDNVAVSICDGISGIILNEGSNYYAINPLPKRLFNETIGEMPHVISRRLLPVHVNLDNRRLNTIYKNTNADLETISVINSTKLPNISNSTAKTFSDEDAKDHIFILDEGTKNKTTKPIFRSKSRRLFPIYTDSNDRIDRNKIDALGITDFKLEAINNTSSKKFRSFSRDFLNKFPRELEDLRSEKILKRNRIKRGTSNSSPIFVETAVFVDRDLYKHMTRHYPKNTERELIRFVLAMINAVQLLYHDPSLGQVVNFVLKRLEILHTDPTGLHRPHDIDKYLSSFCQWQGRENPGNDQDTRHWDHALMLTGLDLYVVNKRGKVSSQVVGLAPVAGMCTKTSSCTVNEGRHFESVYVVAHEIGHNLGMRHDGGASNNDCDSTSFIMSPTLGSGKITWSPCSKNYLQHFLQTAQSRCLLDHGSSGGQLDHSAEGILPGERFDSDQQCMLKYGFGSRHSTQQPLEDICRDMHCERERYTWTSHPALEGTYCGEDKWCRGGRCTDRSGNFRTSGNNEKVSGAWSAWHLSECASGCLYEEESQMNPGSTGIRVIVRSCNNPSPKNGGERCNGPRKRYIACKATQCTKIPRTTISEFADEICTRARKVDKDLLGTGLQRISSDPEEACTVWCRTKNEGAKSRGWTFPDGTKCRMRRNDFYKSTYCIVGRCEEFRCSVPEEYKFIDSSERCYGLSTNRIDRKDDIELLSKTLNPEKAKDDWAVTSNCHFNCIAPGIGIRLVSRIKRRTNETSIQLCDPDSNNCEKLKSPYQFATNICSKYKRRVRRLSGLGIQISPSIEDPDRPCRVACQDETVSHRFYMVNGENGWFPFGTACSKGNRKSFCVTGKCLEFGEDDTPLHESIFALPLLSRYKRSENLTKNSRHGSKTERNNVDRSNSLSRKKRDLEFDRTTVLSHLNQQELDSIIWQLNFSGSYRSSLIPFQIDLNNPIHVPLDEFDYRIYDYP